MATKDTYFIHEACCDSVPHVYCISAATKKLESLKVHLQPLLPHPQMSEHVHKASMYAEPRGRRLASCW